MTVRAIDFDPAQDFYIQLIHVAETFEDMPPLTEGWIRAEEEKWFDGETGTTPASEPEIGGYIRPGMTEDPHGKVAIFPPPPVFTDGPQSAE